MLDIRHRASTISFQAIPETHCTAILAKAPIDRIQHVHTWQALEVTDCVKECTKKKRTIWQLTVFGQNVVGSSNGEFRDNVPEFSHLFITDGSLLFGGIGITASQDGILVVSSKFIGRTKQAWIGEIKQCVVFTQIVLDGCTGEDDSSSDIETIQLLKQLGFSILQTMAFVTQQDTNGGLFQVLGVGTQTLIGDDKNRILALICSPSLDRCDLFLAVAHIHRQRLHSSSTQPFDCKLSVNKSYHENDIFSSYQIHSPNSWPSWRDM